MKSQNMSIYDLYSLLFNIYKRNSWWDADSEYEIILGSILVQYTSWQNVRSAISNLKNHISLSPDEINSLSDKKLLELIRPSGFYNQKLRKIRAFNKFFEINYGNDIKVLKKQDTDILRTQLLKIFGIGAETADSILCYALDKKSFVIDNYTFRLFTRIGYWNDKYNYNKLQKLVTESIPDKLSIYQEFHKCIIYFSKEFCSKTPKCPYCPVKMHCKYFSNSKRE